MIQQNWLVGGDWNIFIYPMVNKLVDPENHQFFMETSLNQPRWLPGSMLIYQRVSGWWFGTCFFPSFLLGILSSQLTIFCICWPTCARTKSPKYVGKYTIHGAYGPYLSGWWFQTCFIFPNSWHDDPIWRTHIFQGGENMLKLPTRYPIPSRWIDYLIFIFYLTYSMIVNLLMVHMSWLEGISVYPIYMVMGQNLLWS